VQVLSLVWSIFVAPSQPQYARVRATRIGTIHYSTSYFTATSRPISPNGDSLFRLLLSPRAGNVDTRPSRGWLPLSDQNLNFAGKRILKIRNIRTDGTMKLRCNCCNNPTPIYLYLSTLVWLNPLRGAELVTGCERGFKTVFHDPRYGRYFISLNLLLVANVTSKPCSTIHATGVTSFHFCFS
jgi:hypothetical protein